MISVEEARAQIKTHCTPLNVVVEVPLSVATGYTLGADLYAKMDIPAFVQSSMDGYAIRFADSKSLLTVSGEMQAGADKGFTLSPFEAARIFTGAPLPAGADTVVMQEKVMVEKGILTILDRDLKMGANVRNKGAEVKSNALAITKGSKLTPAAIGFLAGIGFTDVPVCRRPSVAIIVTGKELQQPGKALAFGQVYEANSYSLTAALEQAQITQINFYAADDVLDELVGVLKEALDANDVVLVTGGVSVGDYDFVIPAAAQLHIRQIFHKVKQKPGKPLYFGKKDEKVIFGLPGNPSSVLSCFYQYVLPALKIMMNFNGVVDNNNSNNAIEGIACVDAMLTHSYSKSSGITNFLKAHFEGGKVTPLNAQESFRMSSFAAANCMIELEENQTVVDAGTLVKVHLLPD